MTMAYVLIAVQVSQVEAKKLQFKRDCLSVRCGNEYHKHAVGTLSWRQLTDVMAGDCRADMYCRFAEPQLIVIALNVS